MPYSWNSEINDMGLFMRLGITTCVRSWECGKWYMWRDLWCPIQKQIWDLLSRLSEWLPGSRFWNARIAVLLVKPSQAPEMPEYDLDQIFEQPGFTASKTSSLCFPPSRAGSLEHLNPPNSLKRTEDFKSLCCFCFGNQTAGLEEGPALCPTSGRSFQFVFQQNRK